MTDAEKQTVIEKAARAYLGADAHGNCHLRAMGCALEAVEYFTLRERLEELEARYTELQDAAALRPDRTEGV